MQPQTENRRSKHSDTVVDKFFPVLVHFHISYSFSVFHIAFDASVISVIFETYIITT